MTSTLGLFRPRRPRRPGARGAAAATLLALALTAAPTPALAAPSAPSAPDVPAGSHWGDNGRARPPAVLTGSNRPPRSVSSRPPSAGQRAWQQREDQRLRRGERTPLDRAAAAAAPAGQGDVPWHRITDFRITDALVGRIDHSTGNLMLAATDAEIAGAGQSLTLTRTYNSLDAPSGQVSRPWWLGYERSLDLSAADAVTHFDDTGAGLRFVRAADGALNTPTGYSVDLRKNADGTHTLTDRASGTSDTYDAQGRLTQVTDRNGGVITVSGHRSGSGAPEGFKLTETRSGRWIDLTRSSATRWQATDNGGRTTGYELDGQGNLVRTTDTSGATTGFAYDTDGRVTRVTSPGGRSTAFTYDAADRITSLRRYGAGDPATGPTHTYAYSAPGALDAGSTKVTDPLGHTTTYEHNAEGEVTRVTDGLGHQRSTAYQGHLVQTATDAMGTGGGGGGGNVTVYGWDARNNPVSTKLPTGATAGGSWQTVAGTEVPSTSTGADGQKTDYAYDTAGNTLSVTTTGTGGGKRTFTYNPATADCGGFRGQRCSATDANGQRTNFRYDSAGNLERATPPAPLGATGYTYDALGRVATVTDGRGVKVVYGYDRRDRVVSVTSSGTPTVTYDYDGDGNLTARTDATGSQSYRFDALNRETVRRLQDGSETVLAYTADGNVSTYTDPGGTTRYAWDAADRLTSLTGPDGKRTTYDYDNNDRRTRTTYPGGTVQLQELDASGRPTRVRAAAPSGIVISSLTYTYGYTAGGQNKDGVKIRSRNDDLTRTRTDYSYDATGRLTLAEESHPSGTKKSWQSCFDPAGNLTSRGTSPGCPGSTLYSYDAASQLVATNGVTTGWSYDKAGNETAGAPAGTPARSAERYSAHGQLSSLRVENTVHDAQYASTDNSERTRLGAIAFHNGPLGLSGQTQGGKDTEFVREPGGTLNSVTTGGRSHYYLSDAIGSVIGLVDETGNMVNTYAYTPQGESREGTAERVGQPYRFAAGYLDPTGLYHLEARYYDPATGRFTQPDPSGQEVNPYLYAEGDPKNKIDPGGLSVLGCIGGGLSVVGGAISTGAGIGSAIGSGGLSTPASLAAIGGGIGLVGTGLNMIDDCAS
ncbi:RHS repeat-associated core domain-containing protein [Streptomyces sp. NPDC049916]|uniref:RHS repeat-associated core domain-containing protein n=1 Tax=Streptomyces sp. NPDC049916 TaxID=3155156 RepID=UPI0034194693